VPSYDFAKFTVFDLGFFFRHQNWTVMGNPPMRQTDFTII
jgi:hypothetical protein